VLEALALASDDETEAASLRAESERTLLSAAGADSTWAADVWSRLSRLYIGQGRLWEAKLAATRAFEGERSFPSDMGVALFNLCSASLDLQEWEDVSRWCGEGRRRYPSRVSFVGIDLVALAGPEGPEPDAAKAWELSGDFLRLSSERRRAERRPMALMQVAAVLARAGRPDSARAVLAQARAGDTWRTPLTDYYEANVRLQLGEEDQALELLTSYLEADPSERSYLAVDWWWNELQDHQGFQRLLEPPG
jgi:tetratricopeptide (TPR) repeat protein